MRDGWARLATTPAPRSMRVRAVEMRRDDQPLLLVTNLTRTQAPAELIGLAYSRRWAIDMFFRWIQCSWGTRRLFAVAPKGVALRMYLILIASLLFQMYSGRQPNKRIRELIHAVNSMHDSFTAFDGFMTPGTLAPSRSHLRTGQWCGHWKTFLRRPRSRSPCSPKRSVGRTN